MRCIKCGGLGKPKGCPSCGVDSLKLNIPLDKKERFITSCRFKSIPDIYIGKLWSSDVVLNSNPDRAKDLKFKDYVKALNKINNTFIEGKFYHKSLFISAPSKMSKTVFACSCMQIAQKHGYTVAPFLDTLEVKRLLVLSSENPSFKLYGWIDYDKYITSDVLFLSVTKTDYFSDSLTIILEILSRRSRMGLPTYILSKFTLKEISQNCIDKDYMQLVDSSSAYSNDLKYPVIIQIK